MNRFDAGAQRVPTGWIGYFRMVHKSENHVLRDRGHDIIFPSEIEAKQAAWDAFLEYLNSPITGLLAIGDDRFSAARKKAELIFLPRKTQAERAGE